MFATIDSAGLNEIIEARHAEPHTVLGLHEVETEGGKALVLRVFSPGAVKVAVLDPADDGYSEDVTMIHTAGFFEKLLEGRDEWFRYKLAYEDAQGGRWEGYDPYSFLPQIGGLDLYLFGAGNHYELYDKLGAHPRTADGIEGVSFAVWAPNAKRVSVVGDFNGWDGRRHVCRMLGNSGVWELFIPGLKRYDRYQYEVVQADGALVRKSDPYGSFHDLRPSASSLIYGTPDFEWDDEAWYEGLSRRAKERSPMNIYELHLGSWKRKHPDRFSSLGEIGDELIEYVKDMGYNYIELMPIAEHPLDASWGYQVTGYYAPTSRFGNPDEYMDFVNKCHKNGIGCILDWVPAHFPKDAHGLARFDGTALYEHEDSRRGEHREWGTLIFNYSRNEVRNFLISNALFWLGKYHFDGLRVDAVASMLYLDYGRESGEWLPNKYGGKENLDAIEFMKHLNSVINERFPNARLVAEESTSWAGITAGLNDGGLGYSFKWNMGWMNDFLTYMGKDPIHRKYHHNMLTFGMIYAYSERFVLVLSHDEVVHGKRSLIDKMGGDIWQKCANLRVSLGFMYGHPGKKLIFMGGEFGQFTEWNENKGLDWFLLDIPHHMGIKKFTRELNRLYLGSSELWELDCDPSGFEWIDCDDNRRSVISFVRRNADGDCLIFICNFTAVTYEDFRVGVNAPGTYREVLNSDSGEFGGSGVTNDISVKSEGIYWNNRPQSIGLRLPPLAVTVWKLT